MNRRIVIPEGATPPHEHDIDQSLHDALAEAMGERKVRFTDRRLLALYLVTVLLFSFFLWQQHSQQNQRDQDFDAFRRATLYNCQREQYIVDKANSYYEAQIATARDRADLRPNDKANLIRNFELAEFPSLRCEDFPEGG